MRRPGFLLLLAAALLCLLSSCGREEQAAETDWTELQMARAVWDSQGGAEEAQAILFGEEEFAPYIVEYYGVDPGGVQGGAVLYAGGVSAQEIAVLRLADADAADEAAEALRRYIDSRAGAFAGYAPEQYAIVENSGAASRGRYAVLTVCPDQQAAQDAFAACFAGSPPEEEPPAEPGVQTAVPAEETPPPQPESSDGPETSPGPQPDGPQDVPQDVPEDETPPEPDEPPKEEEPPPDPEPAPAVPEGPWSYDQARIVEAWSTGDRERLWEQDLAVLDVLDGIPALTDETLTDYARELALHDWMIDWAEYDPGALSNNPRGEPMPDNDNPYGFLTGKKGICLGYASTFQLLMTLSGIECVTVNGMSHGNTSEHAWNLVKLNGDWYAVDVTWDDPVSSIPVLEAWAHRYFNVTSAFLRASDHQWDESAFPEAEGTALAWAG